MIALQNPLDSLSFAWFSAVEVTMSGSGISLDASWQVNFKRQLHILLTLTIADQGYQGRRKRERTVLCPHSNTLHDLGVITSFKVQSPSKYYTRERKEKKLHGSWPRTLIKVFSKVESYFHFLFNFFHFLSSQLPNFNLH